MRLPFLASLVEGTIDTHPHSEAADDRLDELFWVFRFESVHHDSSACLEESAEESRIVHRSQGWQLNGKGESGSSISHRYSTREMYHI